MGNFMSVVTCSADRDDKLNLFNDISTPQQGQGMFSMFTSQEESEQEVRELAQNLDLDKLRVAFFRYAGPDEQMDRKEFGTFSKRLNLSEELGQRLWNILDADRNGYVDVEEFTACLGAMTSARAWVRYCPTCNFDHDCDFCLSIADCPNCSTDMFCPLHWSEHPGNTEAQQEPSDYIR